MRSRSRSSSSTRRQSSSESGRKTRSRSSSTGRKSPQQRPRSRSRSSSASRRPKQSLVRFIVPNQDGGPKQQESSDIETLQQQFAAGMRGLSMHVDYGDKDGEGDHPSGPTPLSPVRKRQRNRSASAKRRSRPLCREPPTRRRNARAPSRSRGRSNDLRRAKSIGRVAKKGQRVRSRSPVDHAAQWLYTVRMERMGANTPKMSMLNPAHVEQERVYAPPLCVTMSDDVELRVTHDNLMADFGYRNTDGRGRKF